MVPLAKGTEVLSSILPTLEPRAVRQKILKNARGFVCYCEVCILPDHLSNALDAKIKAAIEADLYIAKMLDGTHKDYDGGARCLETLITTITEERILTFHHLMMSIHFFTFFRNPKLLREVGQVLVPILARYYGTEEGYGKQPADSLPLAIKDPSVLPIWGDAERLRAPIFKSGQAFHARLERVASNVIASLKRLPS
jgi:hypothetical protein